MLCICDFYSKRQQIKFFEKFYTAARASPAFFQIITLLRQRRHRKNQFGVKTAYQIKAVAKHPQLLGRWHLWNQEKCSEQKYKEEWLERTAL